MAYENATKGSSSVQSTVDKAIRKSADAKVAKGAVSSAKKKRSGTSDALAQAYQQGVLDAIYATQMSQQAPPPGVGGGGPEMPFTQQGPPPDQTIGMPPPSGPGAGAPAMVPPPPGMGGPPPGMGMGGPPPPPMQLPPGLAPGPGIAPGTPGGLSPNAILRSRMPRM